jgi:3-oxoacyl-[acyl-carrier-protein] synthase II
MPSRTAIGPREPIVISGAGVVTPAGRNETWWPMVSAGRASPVVETFSLGDRDRALPVFRAGPFDAEEHFGRGELRRMDRVHVLAGIAVDDLLDGVSFPDTSRVAIVVGMAVGVAEYLEGQYHAARTKFTAINPFAAPVTTASSVASGLAQRHHIHGPALTINTACASGADALALGGSLLRAGVVDHVIAGGVEAPITNPVMAFFARMEAISEQTDPVERACCPFDIARCGFVAGEGATFLLLERQEGAARAGRDPLAALTGWASTNDAHHPVMPHPEGQWAAAAVRGALDDAGLAPDDIESVNAHGTSTPLNDCIEAMAVAAVFARKLPVTSSKGMTGHMLGASGAFEALVAATTAATGSVPPVAGLCDIDPGIDLDVVCSVARDGAPGPVVSSSFGFGGQNTALVLEPVR